MAKTTPLKNRRPVLKSLVVPKAASDKCSPDASPSAHSEFQALYDVQEALGAGTVAVVKRAVRKADNTEIAVKVISGQDEELRQFARAELELVKGLCIKHGGIVRMDTIYESPNQLCICMELCRDGSVESYIKKHGSFREDHAQMLFGQLLRAINFLHKRRVVHRDLKPDNLLLDSGATVIKIADFNSAKQIGSSLCSTMLTDRGTRQFSAPEIRFGHMWNERVDIWASGLCFFVMLTSEMPFDIQTHKASACLLSGHLPHMEWEGVSSPMQNLILQCLCIKMQDRPSAWTLLYHDALSGRPEGCETEEGLRAAKLKRSTTQGSEMLDQAADVDVPETSFFIISRSCGLLSLRPLQQLQFVRHTCEEDDGLESTGLSDYLERRDGSLVIQRLARKLSIRVGQTVPSAAVPNRHRISSRHSSNHSSRHSSNERRHSSIELPSNWGHRRHSQMSRQASGGTSDSRSGYAESVDSKSGYDCGDEEKKDQLKDEVENNLEFDDDDEDGPQPTISRKMRRQCFTRSSFIDMVDALEVEPSAEVVV